MNPDPQANNTVPEDIVSDKTVPENVVPDDTVVVVKDGRRFPYSKGLMATSLMASGLPPDRSYRLATVIEGELATRHGGDISSSELSRLTEDALAREEDEVAVRHFRQWRRLDHLNKPVVLMLCGAAGVGKSTLATMLAHRMGITRVTATDMVRQVLRAFFSNEFMPAVHHSSFNADQGVKLDTTSGDPLLAGFERQVEQVSVGIKALIERAVLERTSLVVEGVYALPGAYDELTELDALVVHVAVKLDSEDQHRGHLMARGAAGDRATKRYLDAFPRIRKLQDYIVNRAQEAGVPVIEISSLDTALGEVMDLVLEAAEDAIQDDAA